MINTEHTKTLALEFCRLLAARDPGIVKLFANRVDWYIQGHQQVAPWLGRRENRDQIAAVFNLLWSVTEPLAAIMDKILVEDDTVIITGRFSTRLLQTGKIADSDFCISFTVAEQGIVRYRLLEDSHAVAIALTGS